MIPIPPGWVRRWQADHLLLKSLERPLGVLKFREVWGPLTTMRRYLDDRIPRLPVGAPEIDKIHPIERVTTEEGEHAAIARVDLRCALDRNFAVKQSAVAMFGVVFGDNFMTSLDGLCLSPPHFDELHATVRDLTRRTVLMLGNPRRRRYVYRMPEGWQALERFWGTRFIPPEYPNVAAMITVHAAVPTRVSQAFVETIMHDQLARGATIKDIAPIENMAITADLSGGRWQFVSHQHDGTQRVHVIVELNDGRYSYKLKLEHAVGIAGTVRPAFDALCASIEPVPNAIRTDAATAVAAASAGTFDLWAD